MRVKCGPCDGRGFYFSGKNQTNMDCPFCNGTGSVEIRDKGRGDK